MSAKEMFKNLGYDRCYNSATTIEYCYGEKENYCVIRFWKNKSYYEDIDNCMEFATMNEWNKNDLLNILQGSDKVE